jgi:alanine-glyoxylate transaminase / serine-glyoxylate transaminase / serine-pyruvate transaminase
METATLPRAFFDFRDMLAAMRGRLSLYPGGRADRGAGRSIEMLEDEGLDNVYARHTRLGRRRAPRGGGLGHGALRGLAGSLFRHRDGGAVPEGCNGTDLVKLAASKYGVAFGVGLGEVAGKVFRIGHLGMLTDVMVLSGLATAEMCMADLGWPVKLGSGVAAAQDFYRGSAPRMALAAE